MSDLVPRDELRQAVETRRELGVDYEDAVAESFIAKVDQRMNERDSQLKRRRDHQKELILGSLGVGIPLLVIGGVFGGIAGIALVCAVLAVIALAAMRST